VKPAGIVSIYNAHVALDLNISPLLHKRVIRRGIIPPFPWWWNEIDALVCIASISIQEDISSSSGVIVIKVPNIGLGY
jgi:hypothetical protein